MQRSYIDPTRGFVLVHPTSFLLYSRQHFFPRPSSREHVPSRHDDACNCPLSFRIAHLRAETDAVALCMRPVAALPKIKACSVHVVSMSHPNRFHTQVLFIYYMPFERIVQDKLCVRASVCIEHTSNRRFRSLCTVQRALYIEHYFSFFLHCIYFPSYIFVTDIFTIPQWPSCPTLYVW